MTFNCLFWYKNSFMTYVTVRRYFNISIVLPKRKWHQGIHRNSGDHVRVSLIAWISNHMPNEVRDEITYPFPNFNVCTVEVWEWISNFTPTLKWT